MCVACWKDLKVFNKALSTLSSDAMSDLSPSFILRPSVRAINRNGEHDVSCQAARPLAVLH